MNSLQIRNSASTGVASHHQPKSMIAQALALLGRREHSRRELVDKLGRHGADATDIEAALENLRERGLQSDPRFAELLVRSRIAQGHGPIRLLAELRQHGIDETVAREAIDAESPDWPLLAATLCARRFRGAPANHAERVRRANFLARRGFPPAIARDASACNCDSREGLP